jgi:hypothetical protein
MEIDFFIKTNTKKKILNYKQKKDIENYLKENNLFVNDWIESIYLIYNERTYCKKCGEETKLRNYSQGYKTFCEDCALKNKEIREMKKSYLNINFHLSKIKNVFNISNYIKNELGFKVSSNNRKKHIIEGSKILLKHFNVFDNSVTQSLYNLDFGKNNKCYCGKNTKFLNYKGGYLKYCSTTCSSNCKENKKVKENTLLRKYGISNLWKNGPFRDNMLEKTIDKYGSYCNRKKFLNTMKENNLYEVATIKREQNCIEKYGVKNVNSLEWVQRKKEETCMKNYNVRFPVQSPEIECMSGGTFKYKDYFLPSGKKIKIQGYEDKLLDELLDEYSEDDILTDRKDMPEFWYIGEDNKKHRYFPDVYIPKINTIFEVKSNYTFELEKNKNLLKEKCVLEKNFKFEFKIY